jgi:hypothetical protein
MGSPAIDISIMEDRNENCNEAGIFFKIFKNSFQKLKRKMKKLFFGKTF